MGAAILSNHKKHRGVLDMSQDNELRRLEQFVEKLLARFNDLRAEKAQLEELLAAREAEIADLRASLAAREEERSEISDRVGRIVEQIEEWEAGLAGVGADVAEDDDPAATEEPPTKPAAAAAEPRVEEEGRVQHNLFSLGAASR
jgi:chromosome segregation ATPase